TEEAMGWAANIPFMQKVGYIGVLIVLGHSVLALSGLETLAQVFRELEYPKIQNLKKTAMIIFVFAVVFTGGLTFLASLIIAPEDMVKYSDNMISGLAMSLKGPTILKLILQGAVVFAGGLMLCGAVNTSIIGANGTMNRIAEAGVLTDWFRKIHKKYGTTYHMINTICMTQLLVIFLSRGKVYLIGQAYAFGVLWSFVFEMISIVVLRFKNREQKREFMMPFNIKFDHYYIPIGATFVVLIVVALAGINLITKKVATISGISFGLILFLIFHISERLNAKKANIMFEEGPREKLNETQVPDLSAALANLPYKENVLVTVKNANNLYHFEKVLTDYKDKEINIVVLYVRPLDNWNAGKDRAGVSVDYKELFTQVILKAENFGKQVHPIMLNSNDFFTAAAQTAFTAKAQKIVMGVSGTYGANEQMEYMVMAWATLPEKRPITAEILWPGREVSFKF
ncbi:MAG: APC family permease, partial [Elusimicrobiaceae bacterium]|nr:APC family permease [Elusimicrobiaceae bacterium]